MKKTEEVFGTGLTLAFYKVIIVCALLCAVSLLYAAPSPLHVEGNKIKDAEEHIIVLRGVCAPDIGALKELYGIHDYIDRVTNPDDPNGSSPGWYTRVIKYFVIPTDSDVTGSPLEFDPCNLSDPNNEAIYEALKDAVNYGAEKGVYSIICPDYHKGINDKVAETNAFWGYIAPRFANDGNVLFELFNEPTDGAGSWGIIQPVMQAWVNTVRASATDNLIIVTGGCWAQQIQPVVTNPIIGDNIVYDLHCFGLTWRTAADSWIKPQIDTVSPVYPVLVTAWGYEPNSDPCVYSTQWSCGSASDFGQPFLDYLEGLGIGSVAYSASYSWNPSMFDSNWQLLCGDHMGCFVKDWLYEKRNAERFSTMTVTNCKITAGKTQASSDTDYSNMTDSFTFSGTFNNIPIDFSQAASIDVNIISLTDGNQIYYQNIECNSSPYVKNGKFGYTHKISKGQQGAITSLTIDPSKRKFAMTANNVDLTGLSCPVYLEMAMGYYTLTGDVNETIVNGKSLIPTRLMRTYKDTLVVDNASAKKGAKPSSDSLSAKGDLAVEDISVNLCNEDVNFIWGDHVFRIPQGKFTASKTGHLYQCSKVIADTSNGNAGLVTASIDIDNATFAVSVSAANSLDVTSNYIAFGVNFADFNEAVNVNRVTKRSY
ncbi:MAG: cellulase family glycosylhydrolase [Sedimentisphaerales bacterium]|jgi:hypothetical protein